MATNRPVRPQQGHDDFMTPPPVAAEYEAPMRPTYPTGQQARRPRRASTFEAKFWGPKPDGNGFRALVTSAITLTVGNSDDWAEARLGPALKHAQGLAPDAEEFIVEIVYSGSNGPSGLPTKWKFEKNSNGWTAKTRVPEPASVVEEAIEDPFN